MDDVKAMEVNDCSDDLPDDKGSITFRDTA